MPSKQPRPFRFTGTLDGPDDFDLVSLSGLERSDDQYDQLWSVANPNDILDQCSCVSIIEEKDFDGMPGQSDTFFKYEATSKKELREEFGKDFGDILEKLKCGQGLPAEHEGRIRFDHRRVN